MRRPLLIMGGLFVLGEAACQMWFQNSYLVYLLMILAGLIIWSVPQLNKFKMISGNSYAFENKKSVSLLLFLCFLFGIVWNVGYNMTTDDKSLKRYSEMDEAVYVTAKISWIDKTSSGQWMILKTGNTRILAYVSDEDISEICDMPGKCIKVRGELDELTGATNPGAFDMKQYYEGKNIRYQINITKMERADEEVESQNVEGEKVTGTGMLGRFRDGLERMTDGFIGLLYRIRLGMTQKIDGMYDEDSAAILKTMLLGDKSTLSNETRVLYQRCGIAHVLAISGLHVALIAGVFGWFLKKFRIRRRVASVLIIGFVFAYGMMTGMSAPTLRAGLMLSIGEMAFIFGRTPDMPTTAIEALLIIAIVSPGSVCSTGTLMSYSAVAGIICSESFYRKLFGRERFLGIPEKLRGLWKNILRTVLMTTSINAFGLPLVMRNYYEVPVFSMILNWIVIPILTVIVAAGFISILLASLSGTGMIPGTEYLEILPVWVCRGCLEFYKWLCRLFIKIPGGIYVTGHMEIWQMVIMYALIIGLVLWIYVKCSNAMWIRRRKEKRENQKVKKALGVSYSWILTYVLSMFLLLMLSMNLVRIGNIYSSKVVFLDVGQGDGGIIHEAPRVKDRTSLIEVDKHGKNYIVDGGSTSVKDVGKYAMIPALRYYAMTDIDCIFISHTDLDHISGIIFLIENADLYGIKIRNVAMAAGTEMEENFQRLKLAIDEYNKNIKKTERSLEVIGLKRGDLVEDRFEVLYPSGDEDIEHSGNDYSLVLRYRSRDFEVLYTGDIGADVEQKLVEESGLDEPDKTDETDETDKSDKSNSLGGSGDDISDEEDMDKDKARRRILKVAHHGSKYSSCEDFIGVYSPDIAVISVGENNTYGHPSEQTLARFREKGVTVYRTDKDGAVIIKIK